MRLFYLILIFLLTVSCKAKNSFSGVDTSEMVTITVSKTNKISPTELIDKFELVPLKTPDNIIVGEIYGLIVTEDRIIVYDERIADQALLFDRDGKYISYLGRKGRGPKEYIDLAYITLMPDGNTIALYDNYGSKMLFFDIDGHFTESKPLPFWFSSVEYLDNNNIVFATYGEGRRDPGLSSSKYADNLILFTDKNFQIRGGTYKNRYNEKYYSKTPHIKKFNDIVYMNPSYCDSIYEISPNGLKLKYHLNMDKIGGKSNFSSAITSDDIKEMTGQYALFDGNFIEGDTFLIWNVSSPPQSVLEAYYYNKASEKTFLIQTDYIPERYFADVNLVICKNIYKNQLISVVPAYEIIMLLPEDLRKNYPELKDLTEDSNPVLIFYSLKESFES